MLGHRGNTVQHPEDFSHAEESSGESLLSPVHKRCAWAPFLSQSQCFWVSSPPMLTKRHQCVFHTTMCWSVCSGMRGISPLNCIQSQHSHKNTHTHLPASGLGQHCSCCCCCCCYFVGNCPRYAATSHVGTLCRHISVEVWSKSY